MITTLTETTKLWNKTIARAKEILKDNGSFEYFMGNTYIYKIEGNTIVVATNSATNKTVIEGKYLKLLQDVISDLVDGVYKINIVLEDDLKNDPVKVSVSKPSEYTKEETPFFSNASIKSELTFNNFVVGEFNKDAHKAALYVAKNGGTLFNPLFIYQGAFSLA